ncbi:PREDICTED: uncharacterized protein LOC104289691 [Charadrius vociferus]|uniref:uncharacterized protein LOC104289691 n=1 Tax=Charadrius vociferus TaxID=50402 RepID=UPI0005219DD1|nr:PREDICTED: uncharacterized protein LOC104289691 [Charadrius vociferus]
MEKRMEMEKGDEDEMDETMGFRKRMRIQKGMRNGMGTVTSVSLSRMFQTNMSLLPLSSSQGTRVSQSHMSLSQVTQSQISQSQMSQFQVSLFPVSQSQVTQLPLSQVSQSHLPLSQVIRMSQSQVSQYHMSVSSIPIPNYSGFPVPGFPVPVTMYQVILVYQSQVSLSQMSQSQVSQYHMSVSMSLSQVIPVSQSQVTPLLLSQVSQSQLSLFQVILVSQSQVSQSLLSLFRVSLSQVILVSLSQMSQSQVSQYHIEGGVLATGGTRRGIVVSTLAEARFFAAGGSDDMLRQAGVPCPQASIGSTPSCSHPVPEMAQLTELHPGNYLFYDLQQTQLGSCHPEEVAIRVLTRVIGHYPHRNQLLVDCGWAALSLHGRAHAFQRFPLDSILVLIPFHACATAAMHPVYYVHAEGKVVELWHPVRGW